MEFHFKSGARSWGESFVKWYRKGQARELQHLLGSGERHNRSRYQQAAAPKPQKRWENTRHSPRLLPAVAAALSGLWGRSHAPSHSRCLIAASPPLQGLRGAELPRSYLFCEMLKISAFIYKYTDRFCVCICMCMCNILSCLAHSFSHLF